ncbi:MAG: biotin-dependent carboxyltransferase family protein [Pseudomonadota bacterium]
MSQLKVTKPGLSSVQDAGRFGLQRYGLAPAGAMDLRSLEIGNQLIGNAPHSAAIEVAPLPFTVRSLKGGFRFAMAGADRSVHIEGQSAAMNATHWVEEGKVLRFGGCRQGVFSYLCFQGGIKAVPQYRSFSVNKNAGLGRPYSRPLSEGDLLDVNDAPQNFIERSISPMDNVQTNGPIRVILGPQDDHFFPESIATFLQTRWRIAHASDRMSYKLDGPRIAHSRGYNIVSDGTVRGSVQITGSGQPLVLLADRGTVGGYPKIATISSLDLDRFSQLAAGTAFSFKLISVQESQRLLRLRAKSSALRMAKRDDPARCNVDLSKVINANVAGNAVSAVDPL